MAVSNLNGSASTILLDFPGGNHKHHIESERRNAGFLDFLIGTGDTHELRAFEVKKTFTTHFATNVFGLFDDREAMLAAATNLDQGWWEKLAFCPGVYLTSNPVDPCLKARADNLLLPAKEKGCSKDENVILRRNLFLDFDPARIGFGRAELKKIMATDREKASAVAIANQVQDRLKVLGFPEPASLDSGNGIQVFYGLDWPVGAETDDLIERFLAHLNNQYGTEACRLDVTTKNRSRICRFPGTHNRKGCSTTDRPHRRTSVLSVPLLRSVLPVSLVEELLGPLGAARMAMTSQPSSKSPVNAVAERLGIGPDSMPTAPEGRWTPERIEAAMDGVGIAYNGPVTDGHRVRYDLDPCPFDPDHTGRDASLFLDVSGDQVGRINFHCFHDHCVENGWPRFKSLLQVTAPLNDEDLDARFGDGGLEGKGDINFDDEAPEPEPMTEPCRIINPSDGHHTAIAIAEERFMVDGMPSVMVVNDNWLMHTGKKYENKSQTGMEQILYPWLASKTNLKMVKNVQTEVPVLANVKSVGNLSHAFKALRSQETDIPEGTLRFPDQAFPKYVVACNNGLLSIDDYIRGDVKLLPHTPNYFNLSHLDLDFDPKAKCPCWDRYPEVIFNGDQDSIDFLQEWYGIGLIPDTSFQKMAVWQGQARAGKGTCSRVLAGLVGNSNVAWPSLDTFGSRFALEPLYGKSAAILADATAGRHFDGKSAAGRVKALTGEDCVDIDRKGRPSLPNVRWKGKITLLCNLLPNLQDDSGVLPSRMIFLKFPNTYIGKEDRTLDARFQAELPGILLWALKGLRRLLINGKFTQPESGLELLKDMTDSSAHINPFLEEYCLEGDDKKIPSDRLFQHWTTYCFKHNIKEVGSSTKFGLWLKAAMPKVKKCRGSSGDRKYYYNGLCLSNRGIAEFNDSDLNLIFTNHVT